MFFKKTFQTRICILLSALLFSPYFFNVFYKGGIGLLNHLLFFFGTGLSGLVFYIALRKKIYKERELPFYENFFLITFVIAFSLSYLTSVTKNVGLIELGAIYAGSILIILGYHMGREKDHLGNLFRLITLSSFISIIVGFGVYFGGAFERFAGTFNNFLQPWSAFPNAFGDFLLLTLPLTFYLTERKKKRNATILSYLPEFTFMIGVSALFLTDSQGVHLMGIALFILMLIRLLVMGKFAKKLVLLTLIGLLLGIGSLSLKESHTSNYRTPVEIAEGLSMDGKDFEQRHSVNTRIEHFKVGFDLMIEGPLFGFGPGSYPYVSAGKLSLLNNSDHPHNLFLKIGIENGIVTLIAFLALVGVVLLRSLLIFFQKLDPAREAVFLGIFIFLMHQMIDYNLNFSAIEFSFFLLLGTLIIERIRKSKRLHIAELRFINHFMLIVFGILLALFSVNYGTRRALKTETVTPGGMIEKGLSANPYDSEIFALSGNFQKAYDLNPHNLTYLLGLYETASIPHRQYLKPKIREILTEYLFLLDTNTSFTILTENPIIAVSLARLIEEEQMAELLKQTMLREQTKFADLYNISF